MLLAPVKIREKLREMDPFTTNQMKDPRCTPTEKKEEREEPKRNKTRAAVRFWNIQ